METAIQNIKLGRQVSIIKEKHSRYIPPTNQWVGGKRRGEKGETAIQNIKLRQVSIIKEVAWYIPPMLIRGGRLKQRFKTYLSFYVLNGCFHPFKT